jgi:hypothetical protein
MFHVLERVFHEKTPTKQRKSIGGGTAAGVIRGRARRKRERSEAT